MVVAFVEKMSRIVFHQVSYGYYSHPGMVWKINDLPDWTEQNNVDDVFDWDT
jgi:hypothetical protein